MCYSRMKPSVPKLTHPLLNVTGTRMPTSYLEGSILQYGDRPKLAARVPMTAELSPYVPQHPVRAFTGGALALPEGGKVKYDPTVAVLEQQQEARYVAFLGRQPSAHEAAREALADLIQSKRTLQEIQHMDSLMAMGLTEEEAKEALRKQLVAKVEQSKSRLSASVIHSHQQQKEAIADLASARGLIVGLPEALSTHKGVESPDHHFTNSERHALKTLLKHKVEKAHRKMEAENRERYEHWAEFGRPVQRKEERPVHRETSASASGGAGAAATSRGPPSTKWSKQELREYVQTHYPGVDTRLKKDELLSLLYDRGTDKPRQSSLEEFAQRKPPK